MKIHCVFPCSYTTSRVYISIFEHSENHKLVSVTDKCAIYQKGIHCF